uniref:Uncharacterized protein n=1 Tax=Takifugu rubripes TaxID=31033 RepID=A0A674PAR2_TAKRU
MITDEGSCSGPQVRYCLKSLREQMAARQNNNNKNCCDACVNLFFPLQAESELYGIRLAEQSERLQEAEKHSEERGQRVEELQRLLARMEVESSVLKEKMVADEAELLQLKAGGCAELEKEVAILKEKIHQLDDMLKSQQRKVRHMIEQLQNSRTIIQERDRVIRDLEEKVAFLEAEVRNVPQCLNLTPDE